MIWLTYLASAHPLLGDHILPSPISPRARWERGARSPLAPTVPFSGTKDRQDATRTNRDVRDRLHSTKFVLFNGIIYKDPFLTHLMEAMEPK